MPIRAGEPIVATLTVGQEEVSFTFPGWDDEELQAAIRELLAGRQQIRRNQVKDTSLQARLRFFDRVVTGCDGYEVRDPAGGGGWVPVTTLDNWRDKIPSSWKSAVVTQVFEERQVLTESDESE